MSAGERLLCFGKIWVRRDLIFPPPLSSPGNGSERSVALLRLLNISTDSGACSAIGLWNSGFEEDLVREAIKEANGLRVPASILESSKWRDVFTRDQGDLPPGAASIVREGTDCNVFRVVEQRREVRCHGEQSLH